MSSRTNQRTARRTPLSRERVLHAAIALADRDGIEALSLLSNATVHPRLVLTDVMMPRMTGPQLAKRIDALMPTVKVLYMSGDVDKAAPWSNPAKSGHAVLQKPFRLNVLNDKIHDLLGE